MDNIEQESRRDSACRILTAWCLDAKQKDQLLSDHETVLAILSIHDSLMCIFEDDADRAAAWPSKPNTYFDGASALDVMISGNAERVRKYLKHHVYNG
jgi:hypothetical protein